MEQVKEVLRYHYYAYRTEQTYCDWILRYLKFHGGKTHPREMGKAEIERFLSHLAVQATLPLRPSASTTARPFGPRNDSTRPTAERTLDNWQSDLGRVCRRVVLRVVCHNAFRLIVVLTARVQIAREPREIAARDLDSYCIPVILD